jgi:hypothetical protein
MFVIAGLMTSVYGVAVAALTVAVEVARGIGVGAAFSRH